MGVGKCLLITGIISLLVISLTLFIVLMALSFEILNYDEYGIKYHKVSRELDNQVFVEGRHYVQPGQTFFRFKSTFITINFQNGEWGSADETPIQCTTGDGLEVEIEATVQYQLRRNELYDLLLTFGTEFENSLIAQAKAAIRDGCGNKTSEEMYNNRQGIQAAMLDEVANQLSTLYVDVGFLELINIELPPQYNNAVGDKESARADVDVALNQRTQALILSQTTLLTAGEDAKIKLIQANATADGIITAATTDAQAVTNDLNTKAQVYYEIKETFNFTAAELINYISLEQLVELQDLIVGVQSPASFGLGSMAST